MKLLYQNPLSSEEDIRGFILEGSAGISFPEGKMRMENMLSPEEGQRANYVLWCPEDFPSDIRVEWKFRPLREPGLAMLFFAAKGRGGEDIFAPALARRTGQYEMYHSGDINAFHISYFRRRYPEERALHTCNLRKSYGSHLVAQGGDPIPDADECDRMYQIALEKKDNVVRFWTEGIELLRYEDHKEPGGFLPEDGKIGFRQMAPLIAEYSDLKVYQL